jgi:16S rRNA (cytosine967-C5)-methyltransferase
MAVAQLMFLDRTPDHVVVDGSVELAKRLWPGREGLVNAVLRRILKGRGEGAWPREPIPARADTAAKRLSILYSHPVWLAERLAAEVGVRAARAVMAANNRPVPPTIRANPLKGTREGLEGLLGFETFRTPISPWGLVPARPAGAPESWPGYIDGLFAIQDEASQILGLLVGSPKTILDACAGLGGKTMAMAAAAPEAAVTAVDLDGRRLKALSAEGLRLGLPRPPKALKGDFRSALDEGALFDLVVLDAPCTGLGVIRRRPDLKWARESGDPARLGAEQSGLLEAAADRVAPGGRLIYSVCSEAPEEGPEVLKAFLERRAKDFRAWGEEELPETLRPLWREPGSLRLSTRLHGTDGFYYGLLSRSGGRRTAKSGRKREK